MTDVAEPPRRQPLLQRHSESVSTDALVVKPESRPHVQHGHGGRRWSHLSHSSYSGFSNILRDARDPPQFQNSYRLGPGVDDKFQPKKAEEILKSVLDSYLGGEKYTANICSGLAKEMSEVIKTRIKDLGFSPRYKFVCLVTVSQNRHQTVVTASRSVWNPETDNAASASFSTGDLFAVANIYAVYFE